MRVSQRVQRSPRCSWRTNTCVVDNEPVRDETPSPGTTTTLSVCGMKLKITALLFLNVKTILKT